MSVRNWVTNNYIKIKKIIFRISTIRLFIAISLAGTVSFIILSILGWNNSLEWLAMHHSPKVEQGDFYVVICWVSDGLKGVYDLTWGAPNHPDLPALTLVLSFLYWKINECTYVHEDWESLKGASFQANMFVILMICITLFLVISIAKVLQINTSTAVLFVLCIVLSFPFSMGGIERGNFSYLTLVILLFALYFKDSDSKIKREIGLFLIAIAAGLKVYPAVFGLLWLKEKRIMESIRMVIYGAILFFCPFFLTGGLLIFIRHMINHIREISTRWVSVAGIVNSFIWHFFGKPDGSVGRLIGYVFLMVMIIFFFFTNISWHRYFYLASIVSFFPATAYRYQLMFMIIPLIWLIKGETKVSIKTGVYIVLFGMLFTIPSWWFFGEVEHWASVMAYVLIIISMSEDLYFRWKKRVNG